MNITYDQAVRILQELDADTADEAEYGRGASEALAEAMGMQEVGESARALLTLASFGKRQRS